VGTGCEGNRLGNLGLAYAALGEVFPDGDRPGTINYYEQALAIFEAIEDPNAEKVRRWLAELDQ
jgi:hypothetical protein